MALESYDYDSFLREVERSGHFSYRLGDAPIRRRGFPGGVQHCTLLTLYRGDRTFAVVHGARALGQRQQSVLVWNGWEYVPLGLIEAAEHATFGLAGGNAWQPSQRDIDDAKREVKARREAEEERERQNREAARRDWEERERLRREHNAYLESVVGRGWDR